MYHLWVFSWFLSFIKLSTIKNTHTKNDWMNLKIANGSISLSNWELHIELADVFAQLSNNPHPNAVKNQKALYSWIVCAITVNAMVATSTPITTKSPTLPPLWSITFPCKIPPVISPTPSIIIQKRAFVSFVSSKVLEINFISSPLKKATTMPDKIISWITFSIFTVHSMLKVDHTPGFSNLSAFILTFDFWYDLLILPVSSISLLSVWGSLSLLS